jgi:hypothetical protein
LTDEQRGQLETLLIDMVLTDDPDKRMDLWEKAVKLVHQMKIVNRTLH